MKKTLMTIATSDVTKSLFLLVMGLITIQALVPVEAYAAGSNVAQKFVKGLLKINGVDSMIRIGFSILTVILFLDVLSKLGSGEGGIMKSLFPAIACLAVAYDYPMILKAIKLM